MDGHLGPLTALSRTPIHAQHLRSSVRHPRLESVANHTPQVLEAAREEQADTELQSRRVLHPRRECTPDRCGEGNDQTLRRLPRTDAGRFGTCIILSGYRHELYNRRIGGARHSQHIYEQSFESVAADVKFRKGTPAQWAAYARGLRGKMGGKGGVGRYDRLGFVHVDNRGWKADWSG